eukprot:3878963-Rhodomonas_salina.2
MRRDDAILWRDRVFDRLFAENNIISKSLTQTSGTHAAYRGTQVWCKRGVLWYQMSGTDAPYFRIK